MEFIAVKNPNFRGEGSSVKPYLALQHLCSLDCRESWKVLVTGFFPEALLLILVVFHYGAG